MDSQSAITFSFSMGIELYVVESRSSTAIQVGSIPGGSKLVTSSSEKAGAAALS